MTFKNVLKGEKLKVSLLTGGQDLHYALGLLSGLVSKEIVVEFIGNDVMGTFDILRNEKVIYKNLRGNQNPNASTRDKILRVLRYYGKLFRFAAETDSRYFHILWLNKFTYFDRTIMNMYYKILGRKVVFTAHDINFRKLVGRDTITNKLTLRFMYRLVDHIIVHTEKMKTELVNDYYIREDKISVIPFGINEVIPSTNLTRAEAKRKLELVDSEKVMLFFGNIAPYKGLDQLIKALVYLGGENIKLIVAGRVKQDCQEYWVNIQKVIEVNNLDIIKRIEYIPEEEAEIYFKAADVLILPYKEIFQSGVIYTSYRFGLPVVASDVGSLRDDIVEGKTGFVCKPNDPEDLARKIVSYYESDMFRNLEENRAKIIQYAREKYSWEKAAVKTFAVYQKLV